MHFGRNITHHLELIGAGGFRGEVLVDEPEMGGHVFRGSGAKVLPAEDPERDPDVVAAAAPVVHACDRGLDKGLQLLHGQPRLGSQTVQQLLGSPLLPIL